ncbi:MAG: ABC transporter ATP-binding protein [Jatrophihabitans sp.]|nr:MAG: ABC transporter ATP-binding protein [Jatrophihabitans sp.]
MPAPPTKCESPLTAFVLLFAKFFTPLINLGDEWQTVQAALAGAERVFAVLAIPTTQPAASAPTIASPGGTHPADAPPPVVQVEHVSFRYRADLPVLHDIDLTVSAGEHLAIVGRTGAGKTSLLALLAGLYLPQTGAVRVAGRFPHLLTDTERRALIGYVPQHVTLFSGTVTDNLALGDEAINADQLRHAATISGAHPFITALPHGYDTTLSDTARGGGVQLSAGQRQQIALARAIAARPALLLLDEATATVDSASDAAFRAALREHVLRTGTAVITIAHRLATARDADRVLVLDHGRIIEHGTPAELLAGDTTFAALTTLESAGWGPDPSATDL